MIKVSKYFQAYLLAIMGVIICLTSDLTEHTFLYGFFGGWFIGASLRLARQSGREEK